MLRVRNRFSLERPSSYKFRIRIFSNVHLAFQLVHISGKIPHLNFYLRYKNKLVRITIDKHYFDSRCFAPKPDFLVCSDHLSIQNNWLKGKSNIQSCWIHEVLNSTVTEGVIVLNMCDSLRPALTTVFINLRVKVGQ